MLSRGQLEVRAFQLALQLLTAFVSERLFIIFTLSAAA